MLTTIDLFAGIGGFSLGLHRLGFQTTTFCEIDPWCRAVLARHWPGAFIHDDIRTLSADLIRSRTGSVPRVVTAGVPCQPASVAGKRKGSADERWLWPELLRVVRDLRDAGGAEWVVAENVPGFASIKPGLDWYCDELEGAGYEIAPPVIVGAEHVGGPHRRHRVWIVAYANGERTGSDDETLQARESQPCGAGADLAYPIGTGLEGRRTLPSGAGAQQPVPASGGRPKWPSRPGESQLGWEHPRLIDFNAGLADAMQRVGLGRPCGLGRGSTCAAEVSGDTVGGREGGEPERGMGSPVDGLSTRLVRDARRHNRNTLKAAGNAVIPAVIELIGRAILEVA